MNSAGEEFGMDRVLESLGVPPQTLGDADDDEEGGGNGTAMAVKPKTVTKASIRKKVEAADAGIFGDSAGCSPGVAQDVAEMRHLETAVQEHVGDAPQSDDLTIVYLAAK